MATVAATLAAVVVVAPLAVGRGPSGWGRLQRGVRGESLGGGGGAVRGRILGSREPVGGRFGHRLGEHRIQRVSSGRFWPIEGGGANMFGDDHRGAGKVIRCAPVNR